MANAEPSRELLQAIAVTSELCGRTFSEAAAKVFVSDLSAYPESQVMGALTRCRKEVRGMLTVQDVVSRLEDGRPGAEEAWSMIPQSESASTVWTAEMAQAFGVCLGLLDGGDKVAARMSFKETYLRLVSKSRETGEKVEWSASLGHDPRGREAVVRAAVEAGRLTMEQARQYIPHQIAESILQRIGVGSALGKLQ